ncbi:unnamed protein product, partial [Symbiodinium pilosum]
VHKAELSGNPDFDNRAAWSAIVSSPCPLASLVNFYLGFLDGSNVCERSLGRMSKLKQQHLGPLEEDGITISMLLELYEDGPQSGTGLATRNVCSDVFDRDHVFLEPTDFLIDCGQLWRQKFGSRFKLYKTRSDIGKSRAKQSGSLVSLRRAQASAADTLAAKASNKSGEDTTIFDGLKRKHLPDTVSLEQNPKFNDKLKDLRAMDQRRQQRHQVLAQRRKQLPRGSPFQVGQVRRAKLVSDVGSNDTGRAYYASRSTLRVVDILPQPVQLSKKHGSQTLDVWRPASSSSLKDALAKVKQCHLLLVEKDSRLHTSPRATVFLANMCHGNLMHYLMRGQSIGQSAAIPCRAYSAQLRPLFEQIVFASLALGKATIDMAAWAKSAPACLHKASYMTAACHIMVTADFEEKHKATTRMINDICSTILVFDSGSILPLVPATSV